MRLIDKSLLWLRNEELYYSSSVAELQRKGLRRESAYLSRWLSTVRKAILAKECSGAK